MAERARRRPLLGLGALIVVLGVALMIGSGAGSGGPPTPAERSAGLATQIRCPSCEDLSVAQSSASSAVAVRHQITEMVGRGQSDQQVRSALVAQYGPSILLAPPVSGLTALVWVVPVVAGAVAVVALGALFWRRSRELDRLRGPR
jgi:cytochrome c-type biogenesis protein CcmH